jgi:hypothetical protein
MARPNLDYDPIIINVKLCLHPDHDDDLVTWFGSLPDRGRATAVILALRSGGAAVMCREATAEDEALAVALEEMFF